VTKHATDAAVEARATFRMERATMIRNTLPACLLTGLGRCAELADKARAHHRVDPRWSLDDLVRLARENLVS
jgi:hypothetical protein